ncbi:MAG: L-serine ammonia-lyase, iron-sulfur-dependent, subunit alpha [Longicatena sp.]
MKSCKELYRIGPGPSSSHTLAPQRACRLFKSECEDAYEYEAQLFGSLSLTGKGHCTDQIIIETMKPKKCIVKFLAGEDLVHPNTMKLIAYDEQHQELDNWTIYSLGGGAIEVVGHPGIDGTEVYPQKSCQEVVEYCKENKLRFYEYVDAYEQVDDYLHEIMSQMLETVEKGLATSGYLPGKLHLKRVAKSLYLKAMNCDSEIEKEKLLLSAYAYSASEENAAGGMTVTSPTLGSSGIIPAIIYYYYHNLGYTRLKIINGLKVASIFGNIIKTNATISGAKGGCQAEIGAACAMGAAMIAYFRGLSDACIEYAAEMGIEHHLGLTCDPVGGYVMIPCIERNAVGTLRAFDSALLSQYLMEVKENKVSFDMVVNTMKYTGQKIAIELKETSLGGLAIDVPMEK